MARKLQLTDFLALETLQEIQDRFAAVTGVRTSIRDAEGHALTRPSDVGEESADGAGPVAEAYFAAAPIEVEGERIGSIVLEDRPRSARLMRDLERLANHCGMNLQDVERVALEVEKSAHERYAAAIEFLHSLANTLARMCFQEHELRRRVEELSTIYKVATELAGQHDLQGLLDLVTRTVCEVMNVKAATLRMLDAERRELGIKSVANLSADYLNKGPVLLSASRIDQAAIDGEAVYIPDVGNDPRILYPQQMTSEGLVSAMVVGLAYRDRPVGVLHAYTGVRYEFSDDEVRLLRALASQAAAAIVNTRLLIEQRESERTQQQIEVARDVQRRMIPSQPPQLEGYDIAGLYTPAFDLGGDFYDVIELGDGRVGLVIADVVGKGVAASLMMASVRSSVRAYAFQYRDIAEMMRHVNRAMCRDTLPSEFVTGFYVELDPPTRRVRFCNAGHNPPLLLRADGTFEDIDIGGPLLGAFDDASYGVGQIELASGDVLLLYTDGLVDSMNFREERYEIERAKENLQQFRDLPARQILGNIRWEIRKFTGLTPRVDDLTMVALKVT